MTAVKGATRRTLVHTACQGFKEVLVFHAVDLASCGSASCGGKARCGWWGSMWCVQLERGAKSGSEGPTLGTHTRKGYVPTNHTIITCHKYLGLNPCSTLLSPYPHSLRKTHALRYGSEDHEFHKHNSVLVELKADCVTEQGELLVPYMPRSIG